MSLAIVKPETASRVVTCFLGDTSAFAANDPRWHQGCGEASVTMASERLLAGQYFDGETNTSYNYFRIYDQSLGRYLQSDPIGILRDYSDPKLKAALDVGVISEGDFAGESLNHLYGYVGQNPLTWFDPFGLAKNVLGSGVESHNGGRNHVHWGTNADPRQNAVNQDGTIRHGKEPTKKIKKLINKTFGWTLIFELIPDFCLIDPTGPGCPGHCSINPYGPGCPLDPANCDS